jgi:hypothetical protein
VNLTWQAVIAINLTWQAVTIVPQLNGLRVQPQYDIFYLRGRRGKSSKRKADELRSGPDIGTLQRRVNLRFAPTPLTGFPLRSNRRGEPSIKPADKSALLNFELMPLWPGLTITEKAFDT